MYSHITLHRGLDLNLQGKVEKDTDAGLTVMTSVIAICPDDFPGFTPKVVVKTGDHITAGQPLMIDKTREEIKIVSPVNGTVGEIARGERRKIMRVTVIPDTPVNTLAVTPGKGSADTASVKATIMNAGLWVMMRQLPYDIIPEADATPANIFITTFDSAPLATDMLSAVRDKASEIKAGIKAILTQTTGSLHIGVRDIAVCESLLGEDLKDNPRVTVAEIHGKHPAGLPSVQAANIAPVNKGESVWMLDVMTLARIGDTIQNGHCDWSTEVAITGSEVRTPHIIRTINGASIEPLLAGSLKDSGHNIRVISGNVLNGINAGMDGFLRFPYRQITVIPEGDDVDEFMGWASMSPDKMSQNRSFISRLFRNKMFAPDARINGGRRAMIMSGQYEKVLPMDIMAEYLIKAIISRDIEQMEALGIYEVTPADFALCEYVDPSKLELQKIVREGLDYLRKELS